MEIQENILLKNYTTFRIGAAARYFIVVRNKSDLTKAIRWAKEKRLPFFILGGGSNLLVADKGFKGLVIKIQNTKYKILNTKIITGAGIPLAALVALSAKNSLTGLEWASGIPGTAGGAIFGNAGAFGESIADSVSKVEALDVKSLKFKIYDLRHCGFGYRQAIFKKNRNLIIFSIELRLKKDGRERITAKIKEYLDYRKERHPKEPSAGSVFKNINFSELSEKKFPEISQFKERGDIPAAYLVDKCGLKGKIIGGAKISEQHPNFILNFNNAKAKDVEKLIKLAKKKVKKKFGAKLKEEIEYLYSKR